jgi:hypothetical protein
MGFSGIAIATKEVSQRFQKAKVRMKTRLILSVVAGVFAAILLFSGCYTQMGTVTNDRGEEQYGSQQSYNDTTYAGGGNDYNYRDEQDYYNNGYYDDWNHPRVGFSYYYPSYGWPSYQFSVAYGNPWYYDAFWWGYDPYMYSNPFYYGSPFLYGGGYYSPYYHSPYYSYYGGNSSSLRYGRRTVGATRGDGGRGANGGGAMGGGYSPTINNGTVGGGGGSTGNLPTAGRIDRSGSRSAQPSGTGTARQPGNDRIATPRTNGSTGTRNNGRGIDSRDTRPQFHAPETPHAYPAAPAYRPPRTGGNREAAPSRGGSSAPPSYAPPAHGSSQAPAHAAPAPRSGGNSGGSRDSGGGRSGSPRSGGGGGRR